jgi:hypothetical protein
LKPAA